MSVLQSIAVIIGVCIVFIAGDFFRFYLLAKKGIALSNNAVAFERMIADAPQKMLVLGDSTAVGTGSKDNALSTAGRLATLYPNASIENRAVNGLKLKGLLELLEKHDANEQFDIILVQIGANDIIRQTDMKDVERDIDNVLSRLSRQTHTLIVLHSGDVGEARIFPLIVRPFLSKRSYRMREIYKDTASRYGAQYVDLIDSPTRKLLWKKPRTYYSEDFLHLSGAGYGLWFQEIQKKLDTQEHKIE